jgi:hypothetical protein
MRTVGLYALVTVACSTGSSGHGPPGDAIDDPNKTLGILCHASFTIAGHFMANTSPPGMARPADNPDGCWPVGTWSFGLTMVAGSNTCDPAPTPLTTYQFRGDAMADPMDPMGYPLLSFVYLPAANDPFPNSKVKANEGGKGSCEGKLDLYTMDGTHVYELSPELDTIAPNSTISGSGVFRIYKTTQWDPTQPP